MTDLKDTDSSKTCLKEKGRVELSNRGSAGNPSKVGPLTRNRAGPLREILHHDRSSCCSDCWGWAGVMNFQYVNSGTGVLIEDPRGLSPLGPTPPRSFSHRPPTAGLGLRKAGMLLCVR